ncbi:hypothetical protein ACHAWF_015444 [Thalassiosira exigua]
MVRRPERRRNCGRDDSFFRRGFGRYFLCVLLASTFSIAILRRCGMAFPVRPSVMFNVTEHSDNVDCGYVWDDGGNETSMSDMTAAMATTPRKIATMKSMCARSDSSKRDRVKDVNSKINVCSFRNDTVMFHVGKAGGGTIKAKLKVKVREVHPRPRNKVIEKLQRGPMRNLIINIRDPVDRFVSAFNWRRVVLCHPNDDRISRKHGGAAYRYPHTRCKLNKEEEMLVRQTYESNPSKLAEALCKDSPSHDQAAENFARIAHSTTLNEWLAFLVDPSLRGDILDKKGLQTLLVLPLEIRANVSTLRFEEYIDRLGVALLEMRYGTKAAAEMECEKQAPVALTKEQFLHSSASFLNSTKSRTLTPLGECCLTRYLKGDYRLIRTMLGERRAGDEDTVMAMRPLQNTHPVIETACSWGGEDQQRSCRGDLMSMLMRRAKYLDDAKGSCSNDAAMT